MEDLLTYDQPLDLPDPDIVNELLNGLSASLTREEHDAALNPDIDFWNHAAQVFDIEIWLPIPGLFEPSEMEPTANDGSRFGNPLAASTAANPPEHETQNVQQESSGSSVYATRNGRFDLVVGSEPGPSQLPARQSQYNSTEHNNSHSSYTELPNNDSPLVSSNPVFMTPPPEPNENGEGRKGEEALPGNNNPAPAGSRIGAMFRCTHPECKRTKDFTRKHNLTQHRRKVHKELIPIVRYRWGTQPQGDSGRRTQRRRGETANNP